MEFNEFLKSIPRLLVYFSYVELVFILCIWNTVLQLVFLPYFVLCTQTVDQ